MRRSNASKAVANRRRARRRRRAIPARRPIALPLFARLKVGLRDMTAQLFTAAALGRHARAIAIRCAEICGSCRVHCVSALSTLHRDLSTIRRYMASRLAKLWAAANSEVELPEINLAPFFRVAGGLFAAIAIGVAGITAWHSTPDKHIEDKSPVLVSARDHHPPLSDPFGTQLTVLDSAGDQHPPLTQPPTAQPAPKALDGPVDAEMQFIVLATGPEDELIAPAGLEIALAPDVDAQDWYDYSAIHRPEEDQVAALSRSPRPRKRPDGRQPSQQFPSISGIPIAPEPPAGIVRAPPQWLTNAIVPRDRGYGPMIAVVIDDAGVAQERTARALELPAPLTIAFIPYSNNLKRQTRNALSRGHELLVHIPMEPGDADTDPGHNALLTSLHRDEIMRRFRWALDRFDGYVGVNNHMGSKFMARADLVKPVLEELNERGLLFLDSRTDHKTVGTGMAQSMGMPHATRNVFLDNDLDAEKIETQLAELERVARRRGHAIGIGHPHDVTTETLAKWIPAARARGFVLVPVSTIVKLEYGPRLASAAAGGEPDRLLGGAQ